MHQKFNDLPECWLKFAQCMEVALELTQHYLQVVHCSKCCQRKSCTKKNCSGTCKPWLAMAMGGRGGPWGVSASISTPRPGRQNLGVIIKATRNCRKRMPTACSCYPTTFFARARRRVPAAPRNQVNSLGVHNHGMHFLS